MNINDPTALTALLDQLKASPEWQKLSEPVSDTPNEAPSVPSLSANRDPSHSFATSESTNTTVASLLAQLQSPTPGVPPRHVCPSNQSGSTLLSFSEPFRPPVARLPAADPSSFTFQQALPLVSQLADNSDLVQMVKTMMAEQEQLERLLWSERQAIFSKYHEKYKTAQTKAKMIGVTVSQPEIDMITDGFNKEIKRFDHERALPAWDGMVSKQQQQLAQKGVPTMTPTSDQEHRKRQQQVIGVLESLIASKE